MGTTPPRLGEPLPDNVTVYRAFSTEGARRRPAKVRPRAYYRALDHTDGLSLGLTPLAAVSGLEVNYGYCSVSVGAIHRLPYGLSVRPDLDNPDHILLCKVPFFTGLDREIGEAEEVAGALARISKAETCDHYPAKIIDDLPPLP
jgi:hypothetical protein